MKILFIANRGEIGGAHTAMKNTILNLIKLNYNITVLTPNKRSNWFDFCNKNKIDCKYIKYYEIGYAFNILFIRRLVKYLLLPIYYLLNKYNYFSAKKAKKIINFNDYDYIHTNTNRDNFGIVLSRIYNVKHIMHLREFDKEFFKIKYLKRNFYNYIDDNTLLFISVSEAIKNNYIKKGLSFNKIFTIYDGINNNKIIQKDKYYTKNSEYFKIIMVSNICKEKGQHMLIDCIAKIKTKTKIIVDFYGTGSIEYINMLKKKTQKLNLENEISFKGYNSNIKELLHNYDLAIMCSELDGFGLVTVEYMLAGLPVLVSNTGANFEIIKDGETGFMFDYLNNNSMANKILYIMKNYEGAIKIANRGREHAIKTFGVDSSTKKLCSLYERSSKKSED